MSDRGAKKRGKGGQCTYMFIDRDICRYHCSQSRDLGNIYNVIGFSIIDEIGKSYLGLSLIFFLDFFFGLTGG